MSNHRGFFELSNLGAEERCGNFFGLIVLKHTTYGRFLMEDHFERKGCDFDETWVTCMLLVSWAWSVMDFNRRKDIKDCVMVTSRLQERIMRDLPRDMQEGTKEEKGSQGWQITKFHSLSFLLSNILKFGC
jgi:hypothetical protein